MGVVGSAVGIVPVLVHDPQLAVVSEVRKPATSLSSWPFQRAIYGFFIGPFYYVIQSHITIWLSSPNSEIRLRMIKLIL